jgi:hypothetical protein
MGFFVLKGKSVVPNLLWLGRSLCVKQARRGRRGVSPCRVVPVAASLFPRPVETRVMSPKKHEPKKDTSACERCRISQHERCSPPLARLATRIVETRRFPSRGCPYRRPPAAAKDVFLDPVVTRSQLRRVGLEMSLPISRLRPAAFRCSREVEGLEPSLFCRRRVRILLEGRGKRRQQKSEDVADRALPGTTC